MRHKDNGLAFGRAVTLPEGEQQLLQIHSVFGVDCAERFIHQQNLRIHCKGTGNRGALLHAAGKLRGIFLPEAFQPDLA